MTPAILGVCWRRPVRALPHDRSSERYRIAVLRLWTDAAGTDKSGHSVVVDVVVEGAPAMQTWAPILRRRVQALRRSTTRRLFPARVELVATSGECLWVGDLTPQTDAELATELLSRVLARGTPALLVLVRPGHHEEVVDLDQRWIAAAHAAVALTGCSLGGAVVVSRWGWQDRLSGAGRSWKRLRGHAFEAP